jgi:hypothetical protein
MENEWLDIACVNHGKYIMHGQLIVDNQQTVEVEQVLTQEQKKQVDNLFSKHESEMRTLLKSFVAA